MKMIDFYNLCNKKKRRNYNFSAYHFRPKLFYTPTSIGTTMVSEMIVLTEIELGFFGDSETS